jgi:hypothetical protein
MAIAGIVLSILSILLLVVGVMVLGLLVKNQVADAAGRIDIPTG